MLIKILISPRKDIEILHFSLIIFRREENKLILLKRKKNDFYRNKR